MKLKVAIFIAVAVFIYLIFDTISGLAAEFEEHVQDKYEAPPVYREMTATAYCINGVTATQTHTRPGIAAGKREWFGKMAAVYEDDNGEIGSLIGLYRIEDTGSEPIRNGRVIDLWMETEEACKQFGKRKVHVYLMEEEK